MSHFIYRYTYIGICIYRYRCVYCVCARARACVHNMYIWNEYRLIGKWPNSYVYTKAIAEDTVRQYSIGIPICIIRPSIVTSTAKEPIEGWINNIYGAVGVVTGSAFGLLHTLYCDPEKVAEIVPADYVISHFIVASWDTAKKK